MRRAYVVELGALDIAQLEAAVGLLQGILGGIQMIEIPEEGDELPVMHPEHPENPENLSAAEEEGERVPDPAFMPPPPAPPMNRQEDFGAGPPPRLG